MADKTVKKENALVKLFFKYKEIIIYILVGGITTLVRWGTTPLFESILIPLGFSGVALSFFTTLISLVVTILFAFVPNKLYVFESKSFQGSIVGKEFIAFIAARAVASLIELFGVPLLAQLLKLPTIIPTIILSIIVLIVNYLFSKLVIFKKRVPAQDETVSEKKAKKMQKAQTRKDKVIAVVTTIICAAIAIIAIGNLCIVTFNAAVDYFSGSDAENTAVTTTVDTNE